MSDPDSAEKKPLGEPLPVENIAYPEILSTRTHDALALTAMLMGERFSLQPFQQLRHIQAGLSRSLAEAKPLTHIDARDLTRHLEVATAFLNYYHHGDKAIYDLERDKVLSGLTPEQIADIQRYSPQLSFLKRKTGIVLGRHLQALNLRADHPVKTMDKFAEFYQAQDPFLLQQANTAAQISRELARRTTGIDLNKVTEIRQWAEAFCLLTSRVLDYELTSPDWVEARRQAFILLRRTGVMNQGGVVRQWTDLEQGLVLAGIKLLHPDNRQDIPPPIRAAVSELVLPYTPRLQPLDRGEPPQLSP
ncbi:MAG: hypothetical protein HY381_02215, partial [Candidatus Chisholmbacteria bacterium]|nr:hypothetical protein [Candidatus Chisholmbacteria bacterium]